MNVSGIGVYLHTSAVCELNTYPPGFQVVLGTIRRGADSGGLIAHEANLGVVKMRCRSNDPQSHQMCAYKCRNQ